jgi:hypothetical protein
MKTEYHQIYRVLVSDKYPYTKLFRLLSGLNKQGWLSDPILKYAWRISQYQNRDIKNLDIRDHLKLECIRYQNRYESRYGSTKNTCIIS